MKRVTLLTLLAIFATVSISYAAAKDLVWLDGNDVVWSKSAVVATPDYDPSKQRAAAMDPNRWFKFGAPGDGVAQFYGTTVDPDGNFRVHNAINQPHNMVQFQEAGVYDKMNYRWTMFIESFCHNPSDFVENGGPCYYTAVDETAGVCLGPLCKQIHQTRNQPDPGRTPARP